MGCTGGTRVESPMTDEAGVDWERLHDAAGILVRAVVNVPAGEEGGPVHRMLSALSNYLLATNDTMGALRGMVGGLRGQVATLEAKRKIDQETIERLTKENIAYAQKVKITRI